MSKLYKVKSKLLEILGDIRWFGFKSPFWFAYGVKSYILRGEHYRIIKNIIKPGDILVRAFDSYIDQWFIPGKWNHGAIFIGGEKEQVVHSMSEGVIVEDILNFMRTDHMAIFRPPPEMVEEGINKAKAIIGSEYDFDFDFSDNKRFSCTEVVDYCYPGILLPSKYLWKTVIAPDDIAKSVYLKKVWDSDNKIEFSTFKV
jgi:hypothetical protein